MENLQVFRYAYDYEVGTKEIKATGFLSFR